MADQNDDGYGGVDEVIKQTSSGGKFMRIDNDVDYQFRIVSKPRYKIRHYMGAGAKPAYQDCGGDNCQYCGKDVAKENKIDKDAQWSWVVIDRDGGQVKIFQGSNAVMLRIKTLKDMKDRTGDLINGDPTEWDVMFKKFKKTNGFTDYSIEPHPKKRGELTAEEKELVKEANIDLETVLTNQKQSKSYDQRSLETAPDDVKPDDIPADLGEEKDSNDTEEVSEDDIPF